MVSLSDENLLKMILELEDKLYAEGLTPAMRESELPRRLMNQLGHKSYVLMGPSESPLVKRIKDLQSTLYRHKDQVMPPIHAGVFMFRGFPGQIQIPHMYGQAKIVPFQLSDFSTIQINWMHENNDDVKNFIDEFSNIFDLAMTLNPFDGYKTPQKIQSKNYFRNSMFHFQSATSVLCSRLDSRGAIQSSLIGCELALKATLIECNETDEKIKNLGHDLKKLSKAISSKRHLSTLSDIIDIIDTLPKYVKNRYSDQQPDILETGRILMATQQIAAQSARLVTKKTIRTSFDV